MKMMSITCTEDELDNTKQWLLDEGLNIFRFGICGVSHSGTGTSLFVRIYTIVVDVGDDETATMLKLKYPPDTFKDCSA